MVEISPLFINQPIIAYDHIRYKAMTCNILVSRPLFGTTAIGRAVIIINAQKLIIYYAVYDAIGRQNLNTQQDITASSSAV